MNATLRRRFRRNNYAFERRMDLYYNLERWKAYALGTTGFEEDQEDGWYVTCLLGPTDVP